MSLLGRLLPQRSPLAERGKWFGSLSHADMRFRYAGSGDDRTIANV
jgi:hypothetical protein